jgi:hypothetical protein
MPARQPQSGARMQPTAKPWVSKWKLLSPNGAKDRLRQRLVPARNGKTKAVERAKSLFRNILRISPYSSKILMVVRP